MKLTQNKVKLHKILEAIKVRESAREELKQLDDLLERSPHLLLLNPSYAKKQNKLTALANPPKSEKEIKQAKIDLEKKLNCLNLKQVNNENTDKATNQLEKEINTLRIKANSILIPENIDIAAQKYSTQVQLQEQEKLLIIEKNILELIDL